MALAQNKSFCRPILLFAFGLGVAGLQVCPQLPDPTFSLFLLIFAVLAGYKCPRLAVFAAFFVGFAYCSVCAHFALANRLSIERSGDTGIAVVEIIDLPKYDVDQWQFQALIIESKSFPELTNRKIKLSWYRTKQKIAPGDIWRFQVKLRIPNGVQNPGGFDSEQRALQQDWVAQGYVKNQAEFLGFHYSIDRFRNQLSNQIARSLPAEKARFVQALGLGDTRYITDADWEVLRRTGITHLIAISGFHVGIVALFAIFCGQVIYRLLPKLGLFLPWPLASAWISIGASFAYTALAGFAIPTLRTTLMIVAFMAAKLLYRNISTIHAVALSLLAILLMDPFSILSPGFWLSFSGVLFLVAFMPVANSEGKLKSFMRAQWLVSLGLLPLSIGFFQQTTLIGPLVNLIAIPWISLVVVPLSLLGLLFAGIPSIATILWQCAYWCMQLLWSVLEMMQNMHWASMLIAQPSIWLVALALIGACLCLLPRSFPAKFLGLFLMLPLLFPKLNVIPYQTVRISVIDVGQGLSVLVLTQNHQLLYDTGAGNAHGFSRGKSTLVPALNALQIRYLDKVIISHGDNDHAGGLQGLKEAIKIGRIEASQMALKTPAFECQQGQSWQWDGVKFTYLWPNHIIADKKNDRSCVLRIEANGRSVLLTGDISKNSELSLVEQYGVTLQSEIIVVPHHGSKTSSSIEFLQAVKPKIAIVSSGFQNQFKHPNKSVVGRYNDSGAQLVNTVETGWAELQSSQKGWHWTRRERIEHQKYWHRATPLGATTGY
ncbi:MAG: DNA internalization-related competence protein ComEC/Rec2 [Arenimonas sp.]|nr:DNA internalization-related competence protein ComEC/Rec2 [Arenimonas sp.]